VRLNLRSIPVPVHFPSKSSTAFTTKGMYVYVLCYTYMAVTKLIFLVFGRNRAQFTWNGFIFPKVELIAYWSRQRRRLARRHRKEEEQGTTWRKWVEPNCPRGSWAHTTFFLFQSFGLVAEHMNAGRHFWMLNTLALSTGTSHSPSTNGLLIRVYLLFAQPVFVLLTSHRRGNKMNESRAIDHCKRGVFSVIMSISVGRQLTRP
jgi:hypothetical protein